MRTGSIAFHLWGQQHAWVQGKKARTSVSWAAAPVNELPLFCWWEGDGCVCSTESHANQGSKGSPGDGKKPRSHQTEDATHNGKECIGAQEKGSSVLAEGTSLLYGAF